MARTGFSFCFAGKYPNCSNPSFSWENSSPWKREVSTWRSNLGRSSQAWQLARMGSQPEGGCSPLPMRVKPRRGSVLTPRPSQDFTLADGQGDKGSFIREARALGTKGNPGSHVPKYRSCLPCTQEAQSSDEGHWLGDHRTGWDSSLSHVPLGDLSFFISKMRITTAGPHNVIRRS